MNYNELTDKAIRLKTKIEQTKEFQPPLGKLEPFKRGLDWLIDAELEGQASFNGFDKPLLMIEKYQEQIRKMKLSGLSPRDREHMKKSLQADLVKAVEQRKAKRITELITKISEHEQAKDHRNYSQKLYDLEILKLKTSMLTEGEKRVRLNQMKDSEYSETELLLLGSNPELKELSRNVAAEVPPKLSNPDARRALRELEQLTSLGTGNIPISYEGSKTPDVFNIVQFIDQEKLKPTIQDHELGEVTLG